VINVLQIFVFDSVGIPFWLSTIIIIILIAYFGVLLLISHYTSKNSTSQSFFTGDKKSPWYLVAFGMIGTSLSGVTFVSVPGTVAANGFYYYQMVLGFFIGYFVVAYVLLPLYYKYNLNVLQIFVFDSVGVPFWLSTIIIIAMIIAYTFRGGVKTIVWTDTLQTVFMLLALVVCIISIQGELNWSWGHIWNQMSEGGMTKLWSTDPMRKDFMWKHIIGGAFITITMTGLDQEMMQKNISVKNLKDAQKNMVVFSFILLFVNALFLLLGGMLQLFATKNGWEFKPDDLFPSIVQQHLPFGIFIIFIIGLISALFPSVDGAITALTSSFCIDILGFERRSEMDEAQKNKLRKGVHLSFAVLFMLLVFYFKWMNNKSIVDLIFTIAGFTYGPLLGLFAFGILTKRTLKSMMVPIVCIIAPLLCLGLTYAPIIISYFDPSYDASTWLNGYVFGYEMLILNGGLTFALLYITSSSTETVNT